MPASVSRRQLRHVAFPRPRLLSPRMAVEMRDDIDEFAASYGVVHDMAMWAHPHRAFRNGNVARYSASGRHAAPADTAGESRRVRAEQTLPHNRMNAAGANDDVGLDLPAVGKAHHAAAITLFDRDAAGSKTEIDRFERAPAPPERCCTSSANDTLRQSIPRWKFGRFSNRPSGSSLHARGMVSLQLGSRGTARDRRGNYGNLPTAVVMRRLIAET